MVSGFADKVIRSARRRVQRAFLMQLNIFLIISTLLIIKPAVNGLFISKFGVENLPLAFVIVALVATSFLFLCPQTGKIPFTY